MDVHPTPLLKAHEEFAMGAHEEIAIRAGSISSSIGVERVAATLALGWPRGGGE